MDHFGIFQDFWKFFDNFAKFGATKNLIEINFSRWGWSKCRSGRIKKEKKRFSNRFSTSVLDWASARFSTRFSKSFCFNFSAASFARFSNRFSNVFCFKLSNPSFIFGRFSNRFSTSFLDGASANFSSRISSRFSKVLCFNSLQFCGGGFWSFCSPFLQLLGCLWHFF